MAGATAQGLCWTVDVGPRTITHLLTLRQLAQLTLPFSGGQVDQLLRERGF